MRRVLRRENVLAKRTQYVSRRIGIRVIGVHAGNDLVLHLGADVVHTRLVLHVIGLFSDIFCGDDLRFFVFHDKYLSVFDASAHLIENFNPAGNRSAERMPTRLTDAAQTGKVRRVACLNRLLERLSHRRNIACGGNRGVRHDGCRTHFHCLASL